ncbi:MAG: SDR family oxidoreductase [Granulosicoccaceae bacterium]
MDLGIRGKTAIVCAGSRGLGRGCAEALAAEGVNLVINGRNAEKLAETAAVIREQHGVDVVEVAADIGSESGRSAVLAATDQVDILINNNGGPPPGLWSDWGKDEWLHAVEQNMITPIMMINAVLPAMMSRGWGRIVNITSQSVKSPIPVLGLSNGARAGLTGFVGGTSRQVASSGVTINNLLPGIHDTDRATALDQGAASAQDISFEDARKQRELSIPTHRYGTAEEFGATCAFMCSQHAGYMIGQNILLDGGSVNTTL